MPNIEDTQEIEIPWNDDYDRLRVIYKPSKDTDAEKIEFKGKVLEKLLKEGQRICKIPDIEDIVKEQEVKPEFLFQYRCASIVLGEYNTGKGMYPCLDFVLDADFDIRRLVDTFLDSLGMKFRTDITYAV